MNFAYRSLLLRPFRQTDLEAYAAMYAGPEVMRYLGNRSVLNTEDAWRQLAMLPGTGRCEVSGIGLLRNAQPAICWAARAESLGERFEREVEVRGYRVGLYAIQRASWRAV